MPTEDLTIPEWVSEGGDLDNPLSPFTQEILSLPLERIRKAKFIQDGGREGDSSYLAIVGKFAILPFDLEDIVIHKWSEYERVGDTHSYLLLLGWNTILTTIRTLNKNPK